MARLDGQDRGNWIYHMRNAQTSLTLYGITAVTPINHYLLGQISTRPCGSKLSSRSGIVTSNMPPMGNDQAQRDEALL